MSNIRGNWMYQIGKTEDNLDAKRLAILIHPNMKECATDFMTYSNRMIKMEVNLQEKDAVTMIKAYAPTCSADDETVEQSNDNIERAMADTDSKYKIINLLKISRQKLGTKTKEEGFKSMGTFGIEERNEI